MIKLENLTIKEINKGFKEKKFSSREITQSYLEKIKEKEKEIEAFLEVFEKEALSQADEVDKIITGGGDLNLLAGIPLAVKDNILIKGFKCTAGSKMLENYKASYDATVIEKLKKEKAVFLGKTNLDEFAMGSSTENSAFKKTRNPYDKEKVPGGSSGGSAAAVASNEACVSLGSDTGGSIRQPAAFCGVVGFKPTYGSVSRYGLIAFASSLDQIGPLANSVEDAEILFEAIKGKDERDSTSFFKDEGGKVELSNLKIALPKEYFDKGIDKRIKIKIEKVVQMLEKKGAEIEEISFPQIEYVIPIYYLVSTSEASSNLSRYDGIRYGVFSEGESLKDSYFKSRGNFGPEVKRRIMLGTYALSHGYYDAYYLKAQKARAFIKREFQKIFNKFDFIVGSTTPDLPFGIGEKVNPLKMYKSDILTVSANLAGIPAISVPLGKVEGLPAGFQIMGRAFRDKEVFQLGKIVEEMVK